MSGSAVLLVRLSIFFPVRLYSDVVSNESYLNLRTEVKKVFSTFKMEGGLKS